MNLKNILPFEKYVLTTNISVEEVLKRVADSIQQKQGVSLSLFSNHTKPYTGEIAGTTFIMSRNIDYRNAFLPVITEQVMTVFGQTQVNIEMRLADVVSIFVSLWLGIVVLVCIVMLSIEFSQIRLSQNGFSPALLIPFGMFVFGCLLTYFAFKGESKDSRIFLVKLLEGIDK